MRERHYTQEQFNNILDILIRFKKSCPDREVSLSENSLKEALEYFMKTGLFENIFNEGEDESDD